MIDWVKAKITETALADRVDPALVLSTASVETGGSFDPNAVGDRDTPYPSYGVLQERIVVGRGGFTTPDTDVARQTHRFDLDVLAYLGAGGSTDPGAIAAAVQRPADAAGYAAKVDALYPTFIGGSTDPHGSSCPAGQLMVNGKCQPAGAGFEPTFPGVTYDPTTGTYRPAKPGEPPLPQNGPSVDLSKLDVAGAITAAVESLKTGAVKFGIAAVVVGAVALLGFGGLKKTFD